MGHPMDLIAELKRRKVFKVGAAYIVVAWLVVQVASIAFPAFDAPPWVLRVFILIAFLGLPIALVFAWAFDFQPDGIQSEVRSRSDKVIFVIAAILVALAFVWYFKGQPAERAGEPLKAAAAPAPRVPADATPQTEVWSYVTVRPKEEGKNLASVTPWAPWANLQNPTLPMARWGCKRMPSGRRSRCQCPATATACGYLTSTTPSSIALTCTPSTARTSWSRHVWAVCNHRKIRAPAPARML